MNLLRSETGNLAPSNAMQVHPGLAGLNEIMFPVAMEPLYDANGRDSEYKGLVRQDTRECLYVGREYTPMHNTSIIQSLDPMLDAGFEVMDSRSYNGRRFEINLINRNVRMTVGDQPSFLRAKFMNSYDGSQAFNFGMGIYVQICSNGATVSQSVASIRRKHMGDMPDIGNWMRNELPRSVDDTVRIVEGTRFDAVDEESLQEIFDKVTKGIPDLASGMPGRAKVMLQQQFEQELAVFGSQPEFALFQATTYLATHGHKQGLAPSYQQHFENVVPRVFFNN